MSQQPKVILPILELWLNQNRIRAALMPSKEKDVFYLKLQWMSAKSEDEKKKLAEKIKQALAREK